MAPKNRPELSSKVKLKAVKSPKIVCHKCGKSKYEEKGLTIAGTQRYYCLYCKVKFVQFPKTKRLVRGKDVWFAEDLGLHVSAHGRNIKTKFNFKYIEQEWFKDIVKRYIKYKASIGISSNTLAGHLTTFNDFSLFLSSCALVNKLENINREIVLRYIQHINHQEIAVKTRYERIANLALLFEAVITNKWFVIEPYLIMKEDYPKLNKALPRYIPDDVIRQLNQHLDSLPESVMRMVLIIQECGLRIGELCQLPLDCLKQDSKGGWFIQFMRWKMKFETTLPISSELAQVISEQQEYIKLHLGTDFTCLFCANKIGKHNEFIPTKKAILSQSFISYIKRLADEFNICDSLGKRWNFQTHQFRHTVGTQMINNGVPQHIVQRYLGHVTPEMTAVYAHIHDTTLRKAIDKYLGAKIVDINGDVIQSITPDLDHNSELQWMKKKVLAETLPNGYCGLPARLSCGKGNACLTCSDFCTTVEYLDQHKQHLERIDRVLEVAKTNGWERQIQVNQDVKHSLEKIIATLEGN